MKPPLPEELCDEIKRQTGLGCTMMNWGLGCIVAVLNLHLTVKYNCIETFPLGDADRRRNRNFRLDEYPHIADIVFAILTYADETNEKYSSTNLRFDPCYDGKCSISSLADEKLVYSYTLQSPKLP